MPAEDSARTAQQALGLELKRLREAAGLSLRQFGNLLPRVGDGTKQSIPHARIQRIEAGEARPNPDSDQLADWLAAVSATPADRQRVQALARDLYGVTSRWANLAGIAPDLQALAAQREREATAIDVACHQWLPGLLQTQPYTRALMTALARDGYAVDPDAGAESRLSRQALLREPGRRFRFLFTHWTARWNPDPGSVDMEEQMLRIADSASIPAVEVRVLGDDTSTIAPWASFNLFEGERPAVSIELEHGLELVQQPAAVDVYRRRFQQMWDAAEPLA